MAVLVQFVVGERVYVDRFTDEIAVFNVLDEFPIDEEGRVFESLSCLTILRRENDEDGERDEQLILRITLPNNETNEFRRNFQFGETQIRRIIQRIGEVPIGNAGFLRFQVSLNGRELASTTVLVTPVDESIKKKKKR